MTLDGLAIVLLVEKDSVFQWLVQHFEELIIQLGRKVLLVTGKGYPCLATREFLVGLRLLQRFSKFYGLFDFDPYGLEIFSVYKYGSKV